MNEGTRDFVRKRAGNRCEYCRIHQENNLLWTFHIEHIVAQQHLKSDHPDGLALACHVTIAIPEKDQISEELIRNQARRYGCSTLGNKNGDAIFAGMGQYSSA